MRSILNAALFACATASAAPSVVALSGAGFSQPQGGGDARISYDLAEAPVIVTLDVQTNTLDNGAGEWISLGGDVVKTLSGDFGIVRETGRRTIKWAASKDWPQQRVAAGRIRAVVSAWATNAPPDWLVVGLRKDGDVRFYAESYHVPYGVTNDLYKGEQLLMCRIPAAGVVWTMGITPDQFTGDETAVNSTYMPHRVMLTKDFFMGVYEVTQAQYTNVGMTAASGFTGYADSWKRPVSGINNGAMRGNVSDGTYNVGPSSACYKFYVRAGSKIQFDLPTETQWEFACRAGTTSAFNNGGAATAANCGAVGWYTDNSSSGGTKQPHVVGLKQPNAFGLYDMHGNVQEWCLDRWSVGDEYVATFMEGFEDGAVTINPTGRATWSSAGQRLVARGGSYTHGVAEARSGGRQSPTYTANGDGYRYNGFRLCCPAVFK